MKTGHSHQVTRFDFHVADLPPAFNNIDLCLSFQPMFATLLKPNDINTGLCRKRVTLIGPPPVDSGHRPWSRRINTIVWRQARTFWQQPDLQDMVALGIRIDLVVNEAYGSRPLDLYVVALEHLVASQAPFVQQPALQYDRDDIDFLVGMHSRVAFRIKRCVRDVHEIAYTRRMRTATVRTEQATVFDDLAHPDIGKSIGRQLAITDNLHFANQLNTATMHWQSTETKKRINYRILVRSSKCWNNMSCVPIPHTVIAAVQTALTTVI